MLQRIKTRYDLMESHSVEEEHYEWPDCLSIDLNSFESNTPFTEALLTADTVYRPDLFFYYRMGTNNLEDIVLWLNDVPSRRCMKVGELLKLPSVKDINSYFLKNRKVN